MSPLSKVKAALIVSVMWHVCSDELAEKQHMTAVHSAHSADCFGFTLHLSLVQSHLQQAAVF